MADLDELTDLVSRSMEKDRLFVRWPVAWIADTALIEAERLVEAQNSAEWGPLDRRNAR